MSPLLERSVYPDAVPGADERIGFRPQKMKHNDQTRKGEPACLTLGMLVVKIPPSRGRILNDSLLASTHIRVTTTRGAVNTIFRT